MNRNIHIGQWVGTVRLPAACGKKENSIYGITCFSVDHDESNRFSFSFTRVRGFSETDVFLVPSFRINGSLTIKEDGRILALTPEHVDAREYPELLTEGSKGERLEFQDYSYFAKFLRENTDWEVPSTERDP